MQQKLAAIHKAGKGKFNTLFVDPTSHGGTQFIRYGFTAGVAFVVDFGLLYIFTHHFNMFYLLSTTLAFAISVVVNYYFSTKWVFANRNKQERTVEIILFVAICSIALGLNDLFMWIFTSQMGIYYLASKLLTVAIVFFWSFGARRILFHSAYVNDKLQALVRKSVGEQ